MTNSTEAERKKNRTLTRKLRSAELFMLQRNGEVLATVEIRQRRVLILDAAPGVDLVDINGATPLK